KGLRNIGPDARGDDPAEDVGTTENTKRQHEYQKPDDNGKPIFGPRRGGGLKLGRLNGCLHGRLPSKWTTLPAFPPKHNEFRLCSLYPPGMSSGGRVAGLCLDQA